MTCGVVGSDIAMLGPNSARRQPNQTRLLNVRLSSWNARARTLLEIVATALYFFL